MPRLLPDDAPPERIGGLLGEKRTAEVGRPEQQAFEAVPMSCRIVSRLWWPGGSEVVMGDVERGTSHGEVAKQCHVRGVRYRLGPRESRPRRWIGGGRMHLLGEITHQTCAIGEVAAPPLGVIEGLRMPVRLGRMA